MSTQEQEIIMMDDPRAAEFRTVQGWVSRDGRFYGKDERSARYAGCTHIACEKCGVATSRNYIICEKCRNARADAAYKNYPVKKWNGIDMIYSETLDQYFAEPEEAIDALEEDQTLADLKLCVTQPNKPHLLSADDIYCDIIPEGGDLPEEVYSAFEVLNSALAKCAPVSWSTTKTALDISDYEKIANAESVEASQ